ncbi:6-phosphogluconolactonase [Dyadobacter sp. CY326]|uniref:6-phosphogluconolactonase n=1 Tax=Dyadobacter sp. CY326 TaxID=2907300 RepID=UPI001F45419A|nr:glucosamine-6-phosphate deaminase [Dyadobacter sp. CY326]MCE7064482.1 glucosamine-6-phosphate deaminase [Dyadobacter sp. CY326]
MKPKLNIYPNYEAMSLAAAERVMALLSKKPNAVICLPSGSTPLGMFEILVSENQKGATDFSTCIFIGLDEWIGFGADDDGGCRNLLNKDFLKPIGLREDKIVFFDGKAHNPDEECARINKVVAGLGGLDLIILGVGMNGHLALNEPGTPWDTYAHVSELEDITKEVGQKYFKQSTIINRGITVGIRHIMESKTAILMASGSAKAPVVKRALDFPVTTNFPATILQNHLNAEYLLDADAASLIEQ